MSCKMIRFDKERDLFSIGSYDFTWSELGNEIVKALSGRTEHVDFGNVKVTVGYLTGMMRFARKHGWFWDNFDICTGDHDFDANVPTPGARYNEIQELKRYVAECNENAHKASCACAYSDVEHWQNEERTANEKIRQYLTSGGVEA